MNLLAVNIHSDEITQFCSESLSSALAHLLITSPSHLPKTQTHSIPPHTHTHTVLSFLDVSVHDSLAANPSVGWMSVSSPFIIRLIRHPRHCFYISQQSHWQLVALFPPLPLPRSFPYSPPTSLSCAISPFSWSLVPYLLCLYAWQCACLWAFMHVFSPPPPSSPSHTDLLPLFLSHPPLSSSSLHVPLHLSISLLCTIGTGVAPSERPVKRPYKKPQHERRKGNDEI